MSAFAFAAGIGIKDKFRFKNRQEKIIKKVVNDSIAEVGGENFPYFRFGNDKNRETRRLVGMILEVLFQISDFFFQIKLKLRRSRLEPLFLPALIVSLG